MPYINIKEYDYTVTGPAPESDNIVVVPINASDGPSDKWIVVHTYEEFVQLFGDNPDKMSTFGNSWEYAANLLLRGMSVCVRRITHKLNDEGDNEELLTGVSIAKNVVKVRDIIGDNLSSDALSKGIIRLTDEFGHSVLKNSVKGEEVDNPLYKTYTYIEDNTTKQSIYANVHVLQTDETNRAVGAFADVATTKSEWNYVGEFVNPHYKYQKFGDTTPMSYIQIMNQTIDEASGNNPYVVGDFFINEAGHVVTFSSTPIPNEYWIQGQKQYPDDLLAVDITNLTDKHFIDVTFNATNDKAINQVWTYSTTKTEVDNHKFINGNIVVNDKTPYKLFETNADLPTEKIGVNYFAPVQSTKTIWVFNGNVWANTGASLETLVTPDSLYSMKVKIPFKCTGEAINTNIYKHYFNWINTGEETYLDFKHPELAYVPTLYWTNSNNDINTRPHKILNGANMAINDIVINAVADASKTSLDVEVNGYQDIVVDKDYTDTRMVSGKFGITNVSAEPIKIYGLKFIQKGDNGESTVLYNAGIENIKKNTDRIKTDPLFVVFDKVNNQYLSDPIPMLDSTTVEDRWYIELNPGCMMYYNRNLTAAALQVKVAGFDNFELECNTFESSVGSYDIALTSLDGTRAEVIKNFVPKVIEEEIDYDNIPIRDANQNFNMFVAEYIYPGVNGNFLKLFIKTVVNQGVYIHVYRNNQFLEKIELCSFRFRNGNTGRINILDMDTNKDGIWRTILSKFGVLILDDGNAYDTNLNIIGANSAIGYIQGQYVKISINPAIVKSDTITSLDYVNSLFAQNGSTITHLVGGGNPDDSHVLHEVVKSYTPLKDKYRYNIKFISNGGYVDEITYPKNAINGLGVATDTNMRLIEDAMIDLAKSREDCVAFLDVPFDLPLEDIPYYFAHISTSYAAAYDPWAYMMLNTGIAKWMPPSFVQLYTHAKSIQSGNKLYLPPAGVRRALVPEILKTNHILTSTYLTAWQDNNTPQFINPVIWINGFDYTIYGQKTLYNVVNESDRYQSALQDLNVRLVANEIKKLIFKTCIELTFELNNIMTWNEFKSKLEPTLSTMAGEGVLTDYDVIMGSETMTQADLNSGHIVGTVRVSVARAATDWDINFELTPNGATFTEYDYNSSYAE